MSVLLSVDPGIRGSGAAVFVGGDLVFASYVRSPVKSGTGPGPAASMASWVVGSTSAWKMTEVALEWPQVYARAIRSGSSKGDPNDLLGLAAVDAAVAALLAPATASHYSPAEWKGQLTKEACHFRIKARLGKRELDVVLAAEVEAGSLAHNVLDAIGIGLHHLKRFQKRRVIS